MSRNICGCGCWRSSHRNLCCVGDDDQSIYSWRGAEIGNILQIRERFPGRADRPARGELPLDAGDPRPPPAGSSRITAAGSARRCGPAPSEGEKIVVRGLWDAEQEARWVGDEIEALQRKGHALSEIAILVRAGFQTREFEERFIALALPYRVIGGPRFYERQEIRDALAYLRLVRPAGGRSRLRAHRQHAAARHRHRDVAAAARRCPRRAAAAGRGGARSDRRRSSCRAPRATRWPGSSPRSTAGGRGRACVAHRSRADRARRIAATPACGRPTTRPTRRAGWKT